MRAEPAEVAQPQGLDFAESLSYRRARQLLSQLFDPDADTMCRCEPDLVVPDELAVARIGTESKQVIARVGAIVGAFRHGYPAAPGVDQTRFPPCLHHAEVLARLVRVRGG